VGEVAETYSEVVKSRLQMMPSPISGPLTDTYRSAVVEIDSRTWTTSSQIESGCTAPSAKVCRVFAVSGFVTRIRTV
jgi:hypothetical protein